MTIDDSVILEAVGAGDWPRLRALIGQLGDGHAAFARVVQVVRRSGALVIQVANRKREAARDALLREFKNFVAASAAADDLITLDALISQCAAIEYGYREIAAALSSSTVMTLPADVRLMTLLANVADVADKIQQAYRADLASGRDVAWQNRRVPLSDGSRVYGDGVISGIADLALLVMQTDARDFIGEDDVVVLPVVSPSRPINLDDVNELIELAIGWRMIGRAHDRLRFFGGSIERTADRNDSSFVVSGPSGIERLDYAANERFHERLQQTFREMVGRTPLVARSRGIEAPCPIEPGAFISPQEGHARVALCEAFCADVTLSRDTPGGLTIMEWLRGYAALQEIITGGYVPGDARTLMRAFSLDGLIGWLRHLGMSDAAARQFIDRVTFRRASADLFDNPIVRRADGSLILYGPTVLTLDLTRVVLSAIARNGHRQDKKGVAFEKVVRKFFEKRGLKAPRLKFVRDDTEYEIDALLEWDGDVFVIECKNWSLSGHNARRACTFWDGTFEAVDKVRRKAAAVRAHPELVKNRAGIDVRGKTVTPVVLHLTPCAMVGAIDGVFVADWSVTTRFFQDPAHNLVLADIGDELKIPVVRQWAGDQPTVAEFKQALAVPFAAKQIGARIELTTRRFATGGFKIELEEFWKAEDSFERTAAAFGLNPDEIARKRDEGLSEMMGRRLRRAMRGESADVD